MPLRTWDCLNRNCRERFDSTAEYPSCPGCGARRLKWVPVRVNTASVAPVADRDLRDLSEIFGLSDLNPAQRDRAAKKIAPSPARTEPWTPQQGWTIPLARDANGIPLPTCAPSSMTSKVKGAVSEKAKRFEGTQFAGGPVPVIEASHRPSRRA